MTVQVLYNPSHNAWIGRDIIYDAVKANPDFGYNLKTNPPVRLTYSERKYIKDDVAFTWQSKGNKDKETVSLGDRAISLHTLRGGVFWSSQNSKCQDLPKKIKLWGGGYSWVFKLWIGILVKMSKNFALPQSRSPCIADSLSHTRYVETNKIYIRSSRQNNLYFCTFLVFIRLLDLLQ